ncbi:MAG: hypothetical protein AAGA46_00465 [Cyanobacteria bacterium P01_F01_bin.13]
MKSRFLSTLKPMLLEQIEADLERYRLLGYFSDVQLAIESDISAISQEWSVSFIPKLGLQEPIRINCKISEQIISQLSPQLHPEGGTTEYIVTVARRIVATLDKYLVESDRLSTMSMPLPYLNMDDVGVKEHQGS